MSHRVRRQCSTDNVIPWYVGQWRSHASRAIGASIIVTGGRTLLCSGMVGGGVSSSSRGHSNTVKASELRSDTKQLLNSFVLTTVTSQNWRMTCKARLRKVKYRYQACCSNSDKKCCYKRTRAGQKVSNIWRSKKIKSLLRQPGEWIGLSQFSATGGFQLIAVRRESLCSRFFSY